LDNELQEIATKYARKQLYVIAKKFSKKNNVEVKAMKKVVLISCVSKKENKVCSAEKMYISPLYKMNLKYAKLFNPDEIFILSAKYGLLELNIEIEPYNETLNDKGKREVEEWAEEVYKKLLEKFNIKNTLFIFLAGEKYRKYLLPKLNHYEIPMNGLTIGKQLQFLKEKTR